MELQCRQETQRGFFITKQLISAIRFYTFSLFAFVFDSWISVLDIMNYYS